ncbi:saccharopine dehydrogenase NADP-binding domain-containing protein [Mycobacterium talmoniae]|uniref:Trans-acting enoyl reductase n=1 Tax=Mycobacterium talmoniae TaxID=1858794 RepID=A0A2S8BNS1_9MYCO|nr:MULTISPECIES: saccharopine dehydrogenase NADP-binding domain-containing protein [Mycobacterium]PQM48307.1 Putative trans-acting enoyl reductase [Mycobacterium talmoniae]
MNRIILLGATGYTGSRTLANLAAASETEIVLVGRSAERLGHQARTVGVECQIVEADTAVPGALDGVLKSGDVVLTTVGPFVDLGRQAARSAARAGAVYLDSTGEPPFVDWMFRTVSDDAKASGALLIPAFGYDYVPGNVAGWLAAREGGEHAAAVEVGYFLWRYVAGAANPYRRPSQREMMSTATTPGTRQSLVQVLGTPSFAYRANTGDPFGLTVERTGANLLKFDMAGQTHTAITIGGSEHFGLPEVLPHLRRVDVGLGWFGAAATPIHYASRFGGPLTTNRIVRRITATLARHLPYAEQLPTLPTRISAAARTRDSAGNILSELIIDAPGPYELTADLLARAALHFATGTDHPAGVHGPLVALGPDTLVALGEQCGLAVRPDKPRR